MASTAGRLRAALWAHHLGVPSSAVADPVRSRELWDTASTRHVCRYDPGGGRDAFGPIAPTGSRTPPTVSEATRVRRCYRHRTPPDGYKDAPITDGVQMRPRPLRLPDGPVVPVAAGCG